MPDITVEQGVPICWANSADYSSALSGIARTHQINLTSLANTDMWQGEKADLGANRPAGYAVKLGIEWSTPPTAGYGVEVYWSSSFSATAGVGNDGGVESTGVDEDWDGVSGGAETERDEYKRQLTHIGTMSVGADAVVQIAMINPYFYPPSRYGFPIIKNKSQQAFKADAVNMFLALGPALDNVALV